MPYKAQDGLKHSSTARMCSYSSWTLLRAFGPHELLTYTRQMFIDGEREQANGDMWPRSSSCKACRSAFEKRPVELPIARKLLRACV